MAEVKHFSCPTLVAKSSCNNVSLNAPHVQRLQPLTCLWECLLCRVYVSLLFTKKSFVFATTSPWNVSSITTTTHHHTHVGTNNWCSTIYNQLLIFRRESLFCRGYSLLLFEEDICFRLSNQPISVFQLFFRVVFVSLHDDDGTSFVLPIQSQLLLPARTHTSPNANF